MKFIKENMMVLLFIVMVFSITYLGTWSNAKMEYNEQLEYEEYLSANLY